MSEEQQELVICGYINKGWLFSISLDDVINLTITKRNVDKQIEYSEDQEIITVEQETVNIESSDGESEPEDDILID